MSKISVKLPEKSDSASYVNTRGAALNYACSKADNKESAYCADRDFGPND